MALEVSWGGSKDSQWGWWMDGLEVVAAVVVGGVEVDGEHGYGGAGRSRGAWKGKKGAATALARRSSGDP